MSSAPRNRRKPLQQYHGIMIPMMIMIPMIPMMMMMVMMIVITLIIKMIFMIYACGINLHLKPLGFCSQGSLPEKERVNFVQI